MKNLILRIIWSFIGFFLGIIFIIIFILALELTKVEIMEEIGYFIIAIFVGIILLSFSSLFIIYSIHILRNPSIIRRVSKIFIILSLFFLIFFISTGAYLYKLFFIPTAASNYGYADGPYLTYRSDPRTSITIIWNTKYLDKSEVEYGVDLNNLNTHIGLQNVKHHIVELSNLNPNTFYYYRIPRFLDKIFNFTTAPDEIIPFNFISISDTQNNGSLTPTIYPELIKVMDAYNYDFITHSGDAVDSGVDLDSWHYFLSNMSIHASTRPYFSVMGNHEQNGDLGANMRYFLNYPYISPYGKYYSFNYSNAHFCFIDVYDNPLADGDWVSDRQYAWLSQDLANNKGKNWIFCFFHDPIYSTGDFGMNKESEAQLGKIFYENQVDIVVNGHDHHYEAFWVNSTESWGGTYYFVSGGAGGNLDTGIMKRTNNRWLTYYHNASKNPYQQDYVTLHNQIYGELVHHFLYFEINGDNMQIKAIRLNGTLIQEFKIRR